MSFSSDLKASITDAFNEVEAPRCTVTRTVTRKLTKAERARDVDPTTTMTFTVRAILDEEMGKADDGTLYTSREAMLDGEVQYNDRIKVGSNTYTVTTVTVEDPTGSAPLYWTVVLK